jgi:hypothetical protein
VTIDNTPANAVPIREQNLNSGGNIKVQEQAPIAQESFWASGGGGGASLHLRQSCERVIGGGHLFNS